MASSPEVHGCTLRFFPSAKEFPPTLRTGGPQGPHKWRGWEGCCGEHTSLSHRNARVPHVVSITQTSTYIRGTLKRNEPQSIKPSSPAEGAFAFSLTIYFAKRLGLSRGTDIGISRPVEAAEIADVPTLSRYSLGVFISFFFVSFSVAICSGCHAHLLNLCAKGVEARVNHDATGVPVSHLFARGAYRTRDELAAGAGQAFIFS